MSVRDVLQRPLDAGAHVLGNLGTPENARDAAFTDLASVPKPVALQAAPGTSLLAAPADHVHSSATPMRIAVAGFGIVAPGARVTLATFKRLDGELFMPGGYAFIRDDIDGVTWENEVDGGTNISTYHERTATPNELRFRLHNASNKSLTVEYATLGLSLPR